MAHCSFMFVVVVSGVLYTHTHTHNGYEWVKVRMDGRGTGWRSVGACYFRSVPLLALPWKERKEGG